MKFVTGLSANAIELDVGEKAIKNCLDAAHELKALRLHDYRLDFTNLTELLKHPNCTGLNTLFFCQFCSHVERIDFNKEIISDEEAQDFLKLKFPNLKHFNSGVAIVYEDSTLQSLNSAMFEQHENLLNGQSTKDTFNFH